MNHDAPPWIFEVAHSGLAETLAALEKESFGDPWSARDLAAECERADSRVWIGRDRGSPQPLGYVSFRCLPGGEVELLRVAVAPAARRRRLAHPLLERSFTALGAAGFTVVHLEVGERNVAARALYARHGFEPVGRRANYYRDGEAALLLRRSRPPQGPVG